MSETRGPCQISRATDIPLSTQSKGRHWHRIWVTCHIFQVMGKSSPELSPNPTTQTGQFLILPPSSFAPKT